MRIENGKIIEATRDELFSKWLDEDWCEIMLFDDYISRMERAGCKVIGGARQ